MRPARLIVIGFRRWRIWTLAPLLASTAGAVHFVPDARAAARLNPGPDDAIGLWGACVPPACAALAATSGAALLRIEDGFIRSVGLGSDLVVPRSLVLDDRGLHCDASRESALEHVLLGPDFPPSLVARAAALRRRIVAHALTKYNAHAQTPPRWRPGDRPVVLVAGQVESDAAIALGTTTIRTNRALLAAARAARPDAFIVYKPHPDVLSGNRRGALCPRALAGLADHVETDAALPSCLAACDEVHVMTSLSGFDALLRAKPVVTWGVPFYAGWGLTEDRAHHPAFERRTTRRSLDELVAAALLLYPRYWDPQTRQPVTAEAAIAAIAHERAAAAGTRLVHGFWRHQTRRAAVLARAWGALAVGA